MAFANTRSMRALRVSPLLLFVLQGCGGGSSSGGEQIVITEPTPAPECRVFVVDKDHPSASDSNDGRYVADGGTGPWRTISYALDAADPCDTIRVRAAASPYREATSGEAFAGIVVARSGEPGKPIVIEGFPGERPVIDQEQTGAESMHASGFVLSCASWITLRNFEIRNVAEAGVTTSLDGCSSSHVTLEQLFIHGVRGGNAVAGIRLAGASDFIVRNNRLEDIHRVRADDGPAIVPSRDGSRRVQVEQNTVTGVERGIALTTSPNSAIADISLHHNLIREGAVAVSLSSEEGGGSFAGIDVIGNVMHDIVNSIAANSTDPSQALTIRNNTFAANAGAALVIGNVDDVSLYNNIFFDIGGEVLRADATSRFALFDNNLYWPPQGLAWTFTGAAPRTYSTLADWQTVCSAESPIMLLADPDTQSRVIDPDFVDGDARDFRVRAGSGALHGGRGETPIGAYFDAIAVGSGVVDN